MLKFFIAKFLYVDQPPWATITTDRNDDKDDIPFPKGMNHSGLYTSLSKR